MQVPHAFAASRDLQRHTHTHILTHAHAAFDARNYFQCCISLTTIIVAQLTNLINLLFVLDRRSPAGGLRRQRRQR
jgi:hypothetical protein